MYIRDRKTNLRSLVNWNYALTMKERDELIVFF